ncbi:hypothetical protein GCM10011613_32980 [Cellvibrio zantedeschiae]|uniref:Methyltransferase type 11 domain-containing protein n=1 Tax=Cellvibrio zantedeschiae TaxID=1237077 RepID=A0ABQ3B9H4_9GAMM|nr:class I SAM-dependent methyltransferase [Cellvibrio zantedeschiae]GGY85265.1 hypothetical protein GCM10011613_32980 [Cellvibrio zantedeschiae]
MESTFKDYFSTKSDAYANYRPKYPPTLAKELAALCHTRESALDCGCGSGQFSVLLADHFQQVIATDASAQQIENAAPHPKLVYKVAPAEKAPLPDHSVDLISVAQAAHWLDLEKFYAEAKRVLKPNGVIALISYQNAVLEDKECNRMFDDFYGKTLDSYWPPERRIVESGYKDLPFPFEEMTFPEMVINEPWNFHQLYGYITTWSAFKAFEKAGGSEEINAFKENLSRAWKDVERTQNII